MKRANRTKGGKKGKGNKLKKDKTGKRGKGLKRREKATYPQPP